MASIGVLGRVVLGPRTRDMGRDPPDRALSVIALFAQSAEFGSEDFRQNGTKSTKNKSASLMAGLHAKAGPDSPGLGSLSSHAEFGGSRAKSESAIELFVILVFLLFQSSCAFGIRRGYHRTIPHLYPRRVFQSLKPSSLETHFLITPSSISRT